MSKDIKSQCSRARLLEEIERLRVRLEASANSVRVLRERQQGLEESESRFRAVLESTWDAVVVADDEGVYVQANPAVEAVFGLSPEELIGRRVSDFLGEAVDFSAFWRDFLAAGSLHEEIPLIRADGQMRYVEAYGVANILPGRHLSVLRDITERKQAEEALLAANTQLQTQAEELKTQTEELRVANEELSAREQELRESESRYRELVQNANSAIVRWKKDGTITFFNEYAQAFFGYSEDEVIGRHVNFLVPQQESTGTDLTKLAQDIVEHPDRYVNHVNENVCRDGRRVWMTWTNKPIVDKNGQVTEVLAVGTDITERKRTEDAMRRLSQFPEENPNPVLRVAGDGTLAYANGPAREWLASLGWEADGPLPASVRGLVADAHAQDHAIEREIGSPGGTLFWLSAVRPAGEDYVNLYARDITARKQAEEELRRDQGLLDSIMRTTDVMLVLLDPEFNFVWVNPAYAETCRMKPEEIVGKNHFALYPDPENEAIFRKVRDTGEGIFYKDKAFVFPDQPERGVTYWDWSLTPARDADGNVTGLVFSLRETTKFKQAQEALRKSEEKFAKAFRSSPIAIAVTRLSDGRIVEVNEAMLKLLHFDRDEVIGRTTLDLDIWVDVNDRSQFVQDVSASGSVRGREYRLRTRDGAVVTVHLSAELMDFGGEHCMLSTLVDVTEHKQAEEALSESRERLERAQEIAHLGSWELDLVHDRLTWSDEVYRIFGLTPREFGATYEAFLERVHPEDRAMVDAAYTGSLRENRDTYEVEHRIVRQDTGEVRIVHEKCEHFRDDAGRIIHSVGMVHDVTERKHAEDALRESEERYHRLFEEDLTGDFISTPDGRILLCNPAFARIFGFSSADEAVGTNVLDLYLDPAEREPLLETLRQQGKSERLEAWRKRRNGRSIYVVENLVGRFDDHGQLCEIKGYLFDDTERKRAEDGLRELNATLESKVTHRTAELEHRARQLQRLTLELSEAEDRERKHLAEILHDDLQQILAAAKFHLNVLRSRAKYDPSVQATVAQIDHMLKDAIDKSRSLSHELSPAILHHGDFGQTLRWLAGQIQSKHGLIVHVDAAGQVDLKSEPLKSFLYKAAQELVFNVVKHARTNEARIRVRRLGRCVCLSVSDQGRGFNPQELRETAGFGLLSIRERVELLGGRMRIKSSKGHGSKFHIVVPDGEIVGKGVVARKGPEGQVQAGEGKPPAKLRVLVADDHEIVREGLLSLLAEEHNIEVVGEAANGREAVDLADRLQPDVVIMDVAMPLIDGDEATRQIKMHLPRTRVIALSMYGDEDCIEQMRQAGAEAYVLKTAPSEELLAAIRGK